MKQLLLVLVAACVFAACKSSTTPTDTTTFHMVSLNDSFSFDNYRLDDTGGVVAGSHDTSVHVIGAVGLTMDGKTNVFRAVETGNGGMFSDTTYYCYESNNDVSMRALSANEEKYIWIKLPASSSGLITTMHRDTTIDSKGDLRIESDTIVATSMGDVSMSIAGKSYTVRKIGVNFTMSIKSTTEDVTLKQTVVAYYSPTFGYVARMSMDKTIFSPAQEHVMISHTVK